MAGRFVYVTLTEPRTLEVSIDHQPVAKLAVDPKPDGVRQARAALAQVFRAHRITDAFCSSTVDFPQEAGFPRRFSARKLLQSAFEAAFADGFDPESNTFLARSSVDTEYVAPCPLCGGAAQAGPVSAGAWGVTCVACRLVLSESLPARWPRGLRRPSKNALKNLEHLGRHLQKLAIERWNRRVVS